jgi:hypothetical protein
LVEELIAVREDSSADEVAEAVTQLIRLAEVVREEPHLSMRFVGD